MLLSSLNQNHSVVSMLFPCHCQAAPGRAKRRLPDHVAQTRGGTGSFPRIRGRSPVQSALSAPVTVSFPDERRRTASSPLTAVTPASASGKPSRISLAAPAVSSFPAEAMSVPMHCLPRSPARAERSLIPSALDTSRRMRLSEPSSSVLQTLMEFRKKLPSKPVFPTGLPTTAVSQKMNFPVSAAWMTVETLVWVPRN